MKIYATFANRNYDRDVVELIDAWDQFAVDENPEGFRDSRQAAIDSWGNDLHRWVTAVIDVDFAPLWGALNPEPTPAARIIELTDGEGVQ